MLLFERRGESESPEDPFGARQGTWMSDKEPVNICYCYINKIIELRRHAQFKWRKQKYQNKLQA